MAEEERHQPRYSSRAVTDADAIRRFLRRHPWGVMTAVEAGEPVPTPLLYVYDADAHAIDTHVSPEGRIAALADEGSRASFTVATMGEIIPASVAEAFSTEYESVIAYGEMGLLEARERKRDALARLMEKFAPGMTPGEDYRAITDAEVDRTAVIRLAIDDWSGKRNRADPDDPTAPFDPDWGTTPN